jgi:hypothetical protein
MSANKIAKPDVLSAISLRLRVGEKGLLGPGKIRLMELIGEYGSISALGPITTKSLYITSNRFAPKSSDMKFSSAAWSWTKTTSASPRRPMSSAWPLPTATTFTAIPARSLKRGRRKPNKPDCSVEVVEATTIERSCAIATEKVAQTKKSKCEEPRGKPYDVT